MMVTPRFSTFRIIWLGQVASLLGSAMTRFALVLYLWQQTGEATPVVLLSVFASIPAVLTNLFAGVLVDRWNRKRTIIMGDLGAGIGTVLLLIMLLMGELQTWQIYLAAAVAGVCGTFQSLALNASVTLLVDEKDYTRAGGMMSLAEYLAVIGAPLLAGILIIPLGLPGIFLIDIISFMFAVSTVALVTIPQPTPSTETIATAFLPQVQYGFRYIFQRQPLVWLLGLMFLFNVIDAIGFPLVMPLILARTGGDEALPGMIQAVMGAGGIVGGIIISTWGGPKRRINGVLLGLTCTGLLGSMLMGLGRTPFVWLIAAFCLEAFIPLAINANRAIWMTKVAADAQGRVFAARNLLTGFAEPIATITGGLLADQLFTPGLQPGGALVPLFGSLVGTGDGAGIALLLAGSGLLLAVAGLSGFVVPVIREVETQLPDQMIILRETA